ncbi:nucleotide exchange factor GrpE [Buchnera aphidicola (Chaitoregma tattakana)]|uniref:nucleotide exchange factor GrpE n=1 Tax=Buchnera aphidicola TaxID=9 RepID=UPI0031B8631D
MKKKNIIHDNIKHDEKKQKKTIKTYIEKNKNIKLKIKKYLEKFKKLEKIDKEISLREKANIENMKKEVNKRKKEIKQKNVNLFIKNITKIIKKIKKINKKIKEKKIMNNPILEGIPLILKALSKIKNKFYK